MPPGDYMITHLWARFSRIRKSFLGQLLRLALRWPST
jgi:hypothetical protein